MQSNTLVRSMEADQPEGNRKLAQACEFLEPHSSFEGSQTVKIGSRIVANLTLNPCCQFERIVRRPLRTRDVGIRPNSRQNRRRWSSIRRWRIETWMVDYLAIASVLHQCADKCFRQIREVDMVI